MVFYPSLGALFAICAIIGGVLFLIRLILQLLGVVGDFHFLDATEISNTDTHIGDSDVSFKLLSLQGLTAFFTMFGLVGLAVEQAGMDTILSLLAAVIAGIISVFTMQKLFQVMGRLQSKGNIDLNNAIGTEGTVYLTIVPSERGKIEINIQNRLRVLDAVTESTKPIKTGERVRVLKIIESNVLLVESVSKASTEKVS